MSVTFTNKTDIAANLARYCSSVRLLNIRSLEAIKTNFAGKTYAENTVHALVLGILNQNQPFDAKSIAADVANVLKTRCRWSPEDSNTVANHALLQRIAYQQELFKLQEPTEKKSS